MLRVSDHGVDVARDSSRRWPTTPARALAGLSDGDLAAAHRVFGALIEAMGAFRAQLFDG